MVSLGRDRRSNAGDGGGIEVDPRLVFLIVLLVLLFLFFTGLAGFVAKLFLIVLLALFITALIVGWGPRQRF